MPRAHHPVVILLTFGLVTLLQGGCTLKATLDTTSDTLSNFFSSTSGRSWLTEDGLVRDDIKTEVFVAANWSNLQQDIARSGGEYLASFEHLLGVPVSQRASFRQVARDHVQLLDRSGPSLSLFATTMTSSAKLLAAQATP